MLLSLHDASDIAPQKAMTSINGRMAVSIQN
jgi:hypothetical protein